MSLELTHDELCRLGERYLRIVAGFDPVIIEPSSRSGERPDLAAWRNGVLTVVEVKTSLEDFRADQKKPHRRNPALGLGYRRFYLTPEQITVPGDQWPNGWGHLVTDGAYVRQVRESADFRFPRTARLMLAETRMLAGALSRAQAELRFLREGAADTVGEARGVSRGDREWFGELEDLVRADGPLKLQQALSQLPPPFGRLTARERLRKLERLAEGSAVRVYEEAGRTMLEVADG